MSLLSQSSAAGGFLTPPFLISPRLKAAGFAHGFFGRVGGVSTGRYESLNAGPGSGDAPEAVAENRRRIAAALGVAADKLIGMRQVHSAIAHRIDAAVEFPEGDALTTRAPGLALCVLTADCAPVLLADPETRVVAVAHAGWRGALSGVLEAALTEMTALGAKPQNVIAAIGPLIRQPSYEVGPEFEAQFLAADAGRARFFVPGAGDRRQFDLPGFCAARLAGAGVAQIDDLGIDTFAQQANFFSCRAAGRAGEPDYGRNAAAIVSPA